MIYKKEEMREFYGLTKPMKFRKLKLVRNYVFDWCKAIRERIKYNYYYILYKLNILKRYSYRDNVEQVLPLPHPIEEKNVESKIVRARVHCSLVQESYIDKDYFYKTTKQGLEVRKYIISNKVENRLFLSSSLKDIAINVVGKWYSVDNLPILKVAVSRKRAEPHNIDGVNIDFSIKTYDYGTFTLNTMLLVKFYFKNFLGYDIEPTALSKTVLQYHYDYSCNKIKEHLEGIRLSDLTI